VSKSSPTNSRETRASLWPAHSVSQPAPGIGRDHAAFGALAQADNVLLDGPIRTLLLPFEKRNFGWVTNPNPCLALGAGESGNNFKPRALLDGQTAAVWAFKFQILVSHVV
jgi:hypothetical protein